MYKQSFKYKLFTQFLCFRSISDLLWSYIVNLTQRPEAIPLWSIIKIYTITDSFCSQLYLYNVYQRVAGTNKKTGQVPEKQCLCGILWAPKSIEPIAFNVAKPLAWEISGQNHISATAMAPLSKWFNSNSST